MRSSTISALMAALVSLGCRSSNPLAGEEALLLGEWGCTQQTKPSGMSLLAGGNGFAGAVLNERAAFTWRVKEPGILAVSGDGAESYEAHYQLKDSTLSIDHPIDGCRDFFRAPKKKP